LDAKRKLAEVWHSDADPFQDYASLVASPQRLLITTLKGQLILANIRGEKFEKISELQLLEEDAGLYSHPALVGNRVLVRGSKSLVCLDLDRK